MLIYYKNREVDKQINQCKKNSICESDIKYKYVDITTKLIIII